MTSSSPNTSRLSAVSCLRPTSSWAILPTSPISRSIQRSHSAAQWDNNPYKKLTAHRPMVSRRRNMGLLPSRRSMEQLPQGSSTVVRNKSLSKSSLLEATLRSVRSQMILSTKQPKRRSGGRKRSPIAKEEKQFRSGLLKFEVELCERLAACSEISCPDPVQKRLDISRTILDRVIQEDEVLGAILRRIGEEYDRAIDHIRKRTDEKGRVDSLSLRKLLEDNDKMGRALQQRKDECERQGRAMAKLMQDLELMELERDSLKEQIMEMNGHSAVINRDDEFGKEMEGVLQEYRNESRDDELMDERKRIHLKAREEVRHVQNTIGMVEAERAETETANRIAQTAVEFVDEECHNLIKGWNERHQPLYGSEGEFLMDRIELITDEGDET